ncbi:MAG: hypothetical protein C4338_00490 [Rhodanobacteraceae bacterium]
MARVAKIRIGIPGWRYWPYVEDVTADFMCLRLHGHWQLYVSGYTDQALDRWAAPSRAWSTGSQPKDAHLIRQAKPERRKSRDVYCCFDNDTKVRARFDAMSLAGKLDLP